MSWPRTYYATNQLLGFPPPTKEVPHTCKIVSIFNTQFTLDHFVSWDHSHFRIWISRQYGLETLGYRFKWTSGRDYHLQKKCWIHVKQLTIFNCQFTFGRGGQIVGWMFCGKGQGGGGKKGGGRRWGGLVRWWNLYLNEVFYKTGIVTSDYGVVTHVTTQNRTQNCGDSPILGESPCNDIMFSKIHHNLARKVWKWDVREISCLRWCNTKKKVSWLPCWFLLT